MKTKEYKRRYIEFNSKKWWFKLVWNILLHQKEVQEK